MEQMSGTLLFVQLRINELSKLPLSISILVSKLFKLTIVVAFGRDGGTTTAVTITVVGFHITTDVTLGESMGAFPQHF